MKKITILLIAILTCLQTTAQDFYTIAGKVSDGSNGEPMRFVSVSLSGSTISNVTNSEGVFTLKLPMDVLRDSTIVLSHLGYMEKVAPISDFEGSTVSTPFRIRLIPVSVTLDAAVINADEAEALVNAAYSRIRDNYPMEWEAMTAFYRELIRKGNAKYLSLSEAILDINKAPYRGFYTDRVGIYKGRGTINFEASDTLFVKCRGGVNALLDVDLVKNPFAGVYAADMFEKYDYKMSEPLIRDGRTFYRVDFNQKPSVDRILYRGSLFIETETLAIGRIELETNVEGREDASTLFVIKKPADTDITVESAAYVLNFKQSEGLWHYDYAHIKLEFTARKRHSLFRQHYSVVSEMAVTDRRPGQFDISPESRLKSSDLLSEKVTDFTDGQFWENYNVIQPDATIEAILRRIVRQLKRRDNQ